CPVTLQRLEKVVKLGIFAESFAVDPRRLRVRLADDLLRAPLRLGTDPSELPLHLAEDLLAAAFTLGAKARRNALALGDHPRLDLLAYRVDVVDALDADVDELDAETGHLARCRLEHLLLELRAAFRRAFEVRLGEGVDLFLGERRHVHLPVGGAHDFLELGAGDDVSDDRVENVVEPRPRALL